MHFLIYQQYFTIFKDLSYSMRVSSVKPPANRKTAERSRENCQKCSTCFFSLLRTVLGAIVKFAGHLGLRYRTWLGTTIFSSSVVAFSKTNSHLLDGQNWSFSILGRGENKSQESEAAIPSTFTRMWLTLTKLNSRPPSILPEFPLALRPGNCEVV